MSNYTYFWSETRRYMTVYCASNPGERLRFYETFYAAAKDIETNPTSFAFQCVFLIGSKPIEYVEIKQFVWK